MLKLLNKPIKQIPRTTWIIPEQYSMWLYYAKNHDLPPSPKRAMEQGYVIVTSWIQLLGRPKPEKIIIIGDITTRKDFRSIDEYVRRVIAQGSVIVERL